MAGLGPVSGVGSLTLPTGAGLAAGGIVQGVDPLTVSPSASGTPAPAADGVAAGQSGGSSFLELLGEALGQLNGQLTTADALAADVASGGPTDLSTAMLAMTEASLSLQLGVAVRDRLLEAYQELMRLQL
jgi:flagellar hook-basal body complex protein FliE